MRKHCFKCCRKHMAQAMVLLMEAEKEPNLYGWHRYIACGHMAEAEDEILSYNIVMARDIREKRVDIDEHAVELTDLVGWFEIIIKALTDKIEGEDK